MRTLFFNEGDLGPHVLGHASAAAVLSAALEPIPDVEARFTGLPAAGRLERAAMSWTTPWLQRADLDLRTLRWHLVQSLRARRAIVRELQTWPADVVHVESHSVALAAGPLMCRVPIVLSVDVTVGDWWAMPAWGRRARPHSPATIAPSRALERRAFERASLVLAWTEWAARAVADTAPGARVVVHHPGLDLDRFHPAPRSARDLPRLLFVGGRFAEKGGEDLLAALDGLLGVELELDLVTPADVELRPGMRLHRLGPGSDALRELYREADVFCLPTYAEGAPWAIVEAMASGTPVISTRVGGIPEQLDEGRAGVVLEPGDRAGLRQAIVGLLADPARRADLAARGRVRCEERYALKRQVPGLVELLRGAVASHGSP